TRSHSPARCSTCSASPAGTTPMTAYCEPGPARSLARSVVCRPALAAETCACTAAGDKPVNASAAASRYLDTIAGIALARVDERRLRALHVAQVGAGAGRENRVRTHARRRIRNAGAERHACIREAEKGDHVVQVDPVAGDADAADQQGAAIDRHAAREDLDA